MNFCLYVLKQVTCLIWAIMKKILIINARPHNQVGGMETYSKLLINLLISKGHEVFEISQNSCVNDIIINKNYNFIHHNYFNKTLKWKNKKIDFIFTYIKLTIAGFKDY